MPDACLIEHDIELVAPPRRAVDRDYVSIVIRRRLPGAAPDGGAVRAEVYYAGSIVASVLLASRDDAGRLSLTHAGAHLDPYAFRIRSHCRDGSISARITIDARPATRIERLAATLPTDAINSGDVFPAYAEMLDLRRAITR
jgi:hypothetical protein